MHFPAAHIPAMSDISTIPHRSRHVQALEFILTAAFRRAPHHLGTRSEREQQCECAYQRRVMGAMSISAGTRPTRLQWTLVNPALVNPVLSLTQNSVQNSGDKPLWLMQTESNNLALCLTRSKSQGTGDRVTQSPLYIRVPYIRKTSPCISSPVPLDQARPEACRHCSAAVTKSPSSSQAILALAHRKSLLE
jgi:hypothetical protein